MDELTEAQKDVYHKTLLMNGAMVVAPIVLGTIVVVYHLLDDGEGIAPEIPPIVNHLVAAGSVVYLAMSPWIAALMVPQLPRPQDEKSPPETRWQGRRLILFALIEGVCFLNYVLCLATGNWWSFGVAAAGVLMMIAMLPRKSHLQQWLRDTREAEAF